MFLFKKSKPPRMEAPLRQPHLNPESFFPTIFTHKQTKLRSISVDRPDGRNLSAEEVHSQPDNIFKIRVASTPDRADAASVLVKKMYSWRGYNGSYQSPDKSGTEEWQRRPNEVTLVAASEDKVFGSVTVRYDSPAGLACDELYKHEIDKLRKQERRLCELTKLAIDRAPDSRNVFASLIHMGYIYARLLRDCTDAVMEVNPRHVSFYEKMLGAIRLGEEKMCSRVNAVSVLLRLDGNYMDQEIMKWGGMGNKATEVKSLYPYFFSGEEEAEIVRRLLHLGTDK